VKKPIHEVKNIHPKLTKLLLGLGGERQMLQKHLKTLRTYWCIKEPELLLSLDGPLFADGGGARLGQVMELC